MQHSNSLHSKHIFLFRRTEIVLTSSRASQYYSPYTSHYPQAAYATHYQAYAPPVAAAQAKPVTAGQYQTSTYSLGTAGTNASTVVDSSDIATLNDALGSAGVDLRVGFKL